MQASLSRTARMKILTASFLALALATASGVATAQTVVPAPFDTRAGGQYDGRYDDGRYGAPRYGDRYHDNPRRVRGRPVGCGQRRPTPAPAASTTAATTTAATETPVTGTATTTTPALSGWSRSVAAMATPAIPASAAAATTPTMATTAAAATTAATATAATTTT